jgi:hypothetical protein
VSQAPSTAGRHEQHPAALQVSTPDGRATLTVEWCEREAVLSQAEVHGLHHYPQLRGVRVMLRSAVEDTPDVFTVVVSFDGRRWGHVTEYLDAAQAAEWQSHQRSRPAYLGPVVAAWLTTMAGPAPAGS